MTDDINVTVSDTNLAVTTNDNDISASINENDINVTVSEGDPINVTVGNNDINVTVTGGSGVTDFTDLQDAPSSYGGESGNALRVNTAENALEFYTPSSDTDEKTKVSSNDTTSGYLNGKLVAGTGITLTEGSDGGDETLTITNSSVITESDPIVGAINGLVKANGAGNISVAVEDIDYQGVLTEGAFADGDKSKLDGIASGAEVNNLDDGTAQGQMAFWDGSKWTYTETSELFWDDTNKRVGIGTNSPDEKLEVRGIIKIPQVSTEGGGFVVSWDEITGDGSPAAALTVGSGGAGFLYDNNFRIQQRPTSGVLSASFAGFDTVMALNSAGKVFVSDGGDTNPPAGSNGQLSIISSDDGPCLVLQGYSSQTNEILRIQNDAGDVLSIIDSDGNVGIGTDSPSDELHVESSDGTTRVRIKNNATVSNAGFLMYDKDDNSMGGFLGTTTKTVLNSPAGPYGALEMGSNDNITFQKGSDGDRIGLYRSDNATWTFGEGTGTGAKFNIQGTTNDSTKNALDVTNLAKTSLFLVRNDGNVGIGITPTAVLHLKAGTATVAPLKLTSGTALTTPEVGTIEFADDRFYITNVATQRAIDRTSDVEITTATIDGGAAEDSTNETTIYTGVIGADALKVGNVLKFQASGVISNNATDNITIKLKLGTTVVVNQLIDLDPVTGGYWHMDGNMTVRTTGANGTIAYHMDIEFDGNAYEVIGLGSSIDTTSAQNFTMTGTWSAESSSNMMSLYQGFMEFKN